MNRLEKNDNDCMSHLKQTVKPNYRKLGEKFGKDINDVVRRINAGEKVPFEHNGIVVTSDDVIASIEVIESNDSRFQWNVDKGQNLAVCLDTQITPELKEEYIANECKAAVTAERKKLNLKVNEKVKLTFNGDNKVLDALMLHNFKHLKKLCDEVKVVYVDKDANLKDNETAIDGSKFFFKIEVL